MEQRTGPYKVALTCFCACMKARGTPTSGAPWMPEFLEVALGTAGTRAPMAALLHSAHDDAVLDGSLGLYSTRRAVQDSCGDLYPCYAGRGSRTLNTVLALLCAAALNRVYVET